MAVYVWEGEKPEVVYVLNKHGVRVERREKYEAPDPPLTRRKKVGPGWTVWRGDEYLKLADGNH